MEAPATTSSTPPRLHAGQVSLTINGGDGDDTIVGSAGNDTVNGGARQRRRLARRGRRHLRLEPRRRQRHRRGRAGNDTLLFNGANVNEKIDISASNGRGAASPATSPPSRWTSTVSRPIDFNALGGADTITVNDLATTDVKHVAIDLESTPGSGVR